LIPSIKQEYELIDLVKQYIPDLQRKGSLYVGKCLHGEKTPSFTVYPDQQKWYCFGCGEGGDVIDFYMFANGIPDIKDAVREMAEAKNIQWKESPVDEYHKQFKQKTKEYHEKVDKGIVYLKSRGLDEKTIKLYELGYSEKRWSEEAQKWFADNSIVIPLKDSRGNTIAFSRRRLDPEAKPKYINSKTSEHFNKGKFLFNLHIARRRITDTLYIVEGYFHSMLLTQIGFPANVALCSNRMTIDQAYVIKNELVGTNRNINIIFIPDMDANNRGQEGCLDNIELIKKVLPRNNVFVVALPERNEKGELRSIDVADYIQQYGGDAFKQYLKNNMKPAEYFMCWMISRSDKPMEIQYQEIRSLAGKIDNPILRDDIAKFLSDQWGRERKVVYEFLGVKEKNVGLENTKSIQACAQELETVLEKYGEGIKLGYSKWDKMVGGIIPGQIYTIVMMSGTGKSATMQNFVRKIHWTYKRMNGLVFTLETTAPMFFRRLMQISYGLTKGEVNDIFRDPEKRGKWIERVAGDYQNLKVNDTGGLSIDDMDKIITNESLNGFVPNVIYIDYANLINAPGKDLYHRITKIYDDLQSLVKKHNVICIVLHQTNSKGQRGERITDDQIREGKVVYERSDFIHVGWRRILSDNLTKEEKEYFEKNGEDFEWELIKNKDGEVGGWVKYKFNPQTLQILDDMEVDYYEF